MHVGSSTRYSGSTYSSDTYEQQQQYQHQQQSTTPYCDSQASLRRSARSSICNDKERDEVFKEQSMLNTTQRPQSIGAGVVNGRTYGHMNGAPNNTMVGNKTPPSPPPKPAHHSWPYHTTQPDYYYVEEKNGRKVICETPAPSQTGTAAGADQHPFFTSGRDAKKPETMREMRIVSSRGTVRGYRNRVRAGIANILDTEENRVRYK